VILSAPSARSRGPYAEQWWNAIAVSSLACLVGFGLGLLVPVVGGILITAGSVAALVAVALGTPPEAGDAGAPG
jgi:tetrahydromethanopterin S-methyltransferase subunit C